MDFSLVVASGGYSLFAMLGLLIVVTSLVVGHGLWVLGFPLLQLPGSRAQAQQLCRTVLAAPSMWDLPGSGIKPMSPALAGEFLPLVSFF